MTSQLLERLRQSARDNSFSGVVAAQIGDETIRETFGYRDGPNQVPNTLETRFGVASITKGFTAVGVASLIEAGDLAFDTKARSIIGDRISNLNSNITVGHLLSHASGIGDYLDEEGIDDIAQFELAIPVNKLVSPLDYIPLIEAEHQKFEPGAQFFYSNSGYIVLSVIIELVSAQPYQDFIETIVFGKAGMTRSGFFRSDSLPQNTATGYVASGDAWRSNLFNLPVRGGGEGGAYTTIDDMACFWRALSDGTLVTRDSVAELLKPQMQAGKKQQWYGYGFWLDEQAENIALVGGDAGVSAISLVKQSGEQSYTVLSNSTSGAWPIVKILDDFA